MNNIKLEVSKDPIQTGHLWCSDCATELNVVFENEQIYRNPRWTVDWDLSWHEFHNVRFIFFGLLKKLFRFNKLKTLICPHCSYKGKIITMDNGLFDIRLIKNSLNADNAGGYKCIRCEVVYTSQKCVSLMGKDGYICGDCAIFA